MTSFRTAELCLLYRHIHFIRNNGLVGADVEIPIHEAIVFEFGQCGTDSLLKQQLPGIFIVGGQLVNDLSISSGRPVGVGERIMCCSNPAAVSPGCYITFIAIFLP